MKLMNMKEWRFIIPMLIPIVIASLVKSQAGQPRPVPRVVMLSDTTSHHQPILTGPPETASMESGFVILAPGESGTQHSTKDFEEALVVLSGVGEMIIVGGKTLRLTENSVAYCPTKTEHKIRNVGTVPLKYVYVAAKAVE